MATGTLLLSLTLLLVLEAAISKPVEDVSFVEGLNFQYEHDVWTCGDIKCPENTFGCKIVLKNIEDDKKVLYQSFNCFDKDKMVTREAGDRIELHKEKIIDIEIETYVGAESVYSSGYGLGGHENAKGVVAVDKLCDLKESGKRNKKIVVDSNAQFEH